MVLYSQHIGVLQRLQLSQDDIAKAFKSKAKIKEFEDFLNKSSQSFEIATDKLIKLAHIVNVPFAYLFLPNLPQIENELPDFRAESRDFSTNLQSCIGSSKKKQEWFKAYLIRNGYDKFLKDKRINSNDDIKQEIKNLSDFDNVKRMQKNERLAHIKLALESHNIIVQQSGVSQNQTRKAINIKECRGYAIYDEYAPLIFINSKDTSDNGKIFTILHELAHILFKHSGVSSYDFNMKNEEYQCNEIAGEILMPWQEFKPQWNKNNSLENNIRQISSHFDDIASPLAIATKALLHKLIDHQKYHEFKEAYLAKIPADRKNTGGNYYSNITASNSKNFAKSVIVDTLNGYETYKDAMDLLDIKSVKTFKNLAQNLGID